jgi:hypothetical protein
MKIANLKVRIVRPTICIILLLIINLKGFIALASGPVEISFDTVINGTIEALGERDTFAFNGTQDDLITIRIKPSGYFEGNVQVMAPNDSIIATKTNGWGGMVAIENLKLPVTGKYSIIFCETEGDETCSYWLTLQSRNEVLLNAKQIDFDAVVNDSINPIVDVDAYTFDGTEDDLITLRIKPSGYFEGNVQVMAPNDSIIATKTNGWGGMVAIENLKLPATGKYSIIFCETEGDETCSYWLTLQSRNGVLLNAKQIDFDAVVNDSINPIVDVDAYTFDGTEDDLITLRIKPFGYFEGNVQVMAPNDSIIATKTNGWGGMVAIENLKLPATGKYSIIFCETEGDETCTYWLSLQSMKDVLSKADTLKTNNGNLTIDVSKLGFLKAYVFLVDEDDVTQFKLTRKSGYSDPHAELFGPDDTLMIHKATNYETTIEDEVFQKSGLYKLIVSDENADETGTFEMNWSGITNSVIKIIDLLSPPGITPMNATVYPAIICQNIGWDEQEYSAWIKVYSVYSDSIGNLNLLPGMTDTINFKSWIPGEAAAYVMHGFSRSVDKLSTDEKIKIIAVSKGSGPEIHNREPEYAVNGSTASVKITGTGFVGGTVATLTCNGKPDINAASVNYVSNNEILATFNLLNTTESNWDIVVSNPDNQSYTFYEGFRTIEFEGQQLTFNQWEKFNVAQRTTIQVGVSVPSGLQDLFVLLKKTTHLGYSGTWNGGIRILKDGEILHEETGNEDFDLQFSHPEAGWYNIEIWSNDPGEGLINVCSAMDTLSPGNWQIGEVMRPYGNHWMQLDIPSGQQKLYFETEGVGLWSTLDVYLDSLTNKTDHWQFSHMGEGYHITGNIVNPKPGRYYLKYMDSGVLQGTQSQTRQYMIIASTQPVDEPAPVETVITGLSTYEVGQGPVTIEVYGTGLDSAFNAAIVREGYENIYAEDVSIDTMFRKLLAHFDLTNADTGKYSLIVKNIYNETISGPQLIHIIASNEPKLWVEIIGREQIRIGRKQSILIRYGNNGNCDVNNGLLVFECPSQAIDSIYLPNLSIDQGLAFNLQDTNFIFIRHIYAKSSGEIKITLYENNAFLEFISVKASFIKLTEYSQISPLVNSNKAYIIAVDPAKVKFSDLKNGDIVYINFGSLNETAHDGLFADNVDPFGIGKSNAYILELKKQGINLFNLKGTVVARRWEYSEVEKAYFNLQLMNLKTNSITRDELVSDFKNKYGADVDEFIDKGQLLNWVDVNGKDKYMGNARPIDDNDLNRGEKIDKVIQQALNDVKDYNVNAKYKYDLLRRLVDGNEYGHCGNLINDWYAVVGVDIPGFNDWPYEQINEFLKQEKMNLTENYKDFQTLRDKFLELLLTDVDIDDFLKLIGSDLFLEIVNSLTPEDKYGTPGFDSPEKSTGTLSRYVNKDDAFTYRIDFWNHENATAPAQEVFIWDTLDMDLNDSTLAFTEFGFLRWKIKLDGGQYFNVNVDMRPDMDLIVNAEGKYDPDTREIYYKFRSLDPVTMDLPEDPLAGFLPPIDTSGYQIGWVEYEIESNKNLSTGATITNQAWVNFDGVGSTNPAPKEAPWLNTIDATAPVSEVDPGITWLDSTSYKLTWYGEDEEGGSGVVSYSIYVSEDNGDYVTWISNTADTSWVFTGEVDHAYRFYSIARDGAGNTEKAPNGFDASLLVTSIDEYEPTPGGNTIVLNCIPNPFSNYTTVTYILPEKGNVVLQLFDIRGALMKSLVNENQGRGPHELILKDEDLLPGLYFIKITYTNTKECIIKTDKVLKYNK